jgi:phosphoribosyl 1,2-cyclic phosphodiesterase
MIFRDFMAGQTIDLGDGITLRTAPLNHPQGATGYRVDYDGVSVCYVTDTEHRPGKLDADILTLIHGANLVIYDSTYTDQEFFRYAGWGHSTWQQGVRLCQAAQVEQLAIFHHDPDHDDNVMDRIAEEAHDMWPDAFVAKEGQQLTL